MKSKNNDSFPEGSYVTCTGGGGDEGGLQRPGVNWVLLGVNANGRTGLN